MKTLIKSILFVLVSAAGAAQAADMVTVPYVDVARYIGRWYQISRNPLAFEPPSCPCAQQSLGVRADGLVSVFNSCNEGSPTGALREIRGIAVNDDPQTNARFTVDFGLPHKGQYWVIGLADDYRWAVVSDPGRYSLYILSKTPQLSDADYEAAVAVAATQTSTAKLARTSHEGCTYPTEMQ